jgi:hypothetical protein
VASFAQDLLLSQPPAEDTPVQTTAKTAEVKKDKVAGPPTLLIQEVKEKWEYVKRRVKSKKDGAKIAALLNGYTIVGIDEHTSVPVVVIAAGALFHYTTLQQQTHYDIIEWALKAELKRDCKVRMLPPGQGGPGVSIPPPPTQSPAINGMVSRTTLAPHEPQPHRPAHKEQLAPVPENVAAGRDTPQPQQVVPQNGVASRDMPQPLQVMPPSKEEPKAQSDQRGPVSSAALASDVSSQSPPLARTTDMRENTNRGDSRLLFAQKKAKNDQVVQEVVRLFKAEVKDIQLK